MENKNEVANMSRRKALSFVGFLVSIILLIFAIFLSINQENAEKLATIETRTEEQNLVEIVSSDLGKNINEVKEEKSLLSTIEDSTEENNINSNVAVENTTNTEVEKKVFSNAQTEKEKELFSNENIKSTATEPIEINNEQTEDNLEEQAISQFIKPVDGEIIKCFSMDKLVYSETLKEWVTHRGIDIKANKLKEVKASSSGKVKSIKTDPRYGLSVIVEHKDGFETVYSCLVSTDGIEEGQEVKQGDIIGKVGNSGVFEVSEGNHIHFEMLKDENYVNPELYIK